MNGNCLDIGTIQAFLDGETRGEDALRISDHIADCDACTILLATAEEESSLVYSVLDREINTLVPSQRLWSRINESICEERSRTSVWERFTTFLAAALLSPSYAAAAGLLLVVGVTAIVWTSSSGSNEMLTAAIPSAPAGSSVAPAALPGPEVAASAPLADTSAANGPARVKVTNYTPDQLARMIRADNRAAGTRQASAQRASAAAPRYLQGEETYVRAIGELQQNVSVQNASMSPSSQVSFAKDLAMIDESIKRMREVVRKNPRNQAARQVLYSSYQDKMDLLRSSTQRDDLMASLER